MKKLYADVDRLDLPKTGIFILAYHGTERKPTDIAHLDKASLLEFLTARGDSNPWAEDCVGIILGHGHLHEGT